MDRLKVLWFIFILGNIYDVVISFIAWHYQDQVVELNPVINLFNIQSPILMLETAIGLKLILFATIYWSTKIFDKLNLNKLAILLPFTIVTLIVVILDTYNLSPL